MEEKIYKINNLQCRRNRTFFPIRPIKTLATKNDRAKGAKKDKELCSVAMQRERKNLSRLLQVNSKILVASTKSTQRLLPVAYSNNKKAWMTIEKWSEWLKWFANQLSQTSLLLIDNCPAHTDGASLGLKNYKSSFFQRILQLTFNR